MVGTSTLLHLEWPKLYRVLAVLSAVGLSFCQAPFCDSSQTGKSMFSVVAFLFISVAFYRNIYSQLLISQSRSLFQSTDISK